MSGLRTWACKKSKPEQHTWEGNTEKCTKLIKCKFGGYHTFIYRYSKNTSYCSCLMTQELYYESVSCLIKAPHAESFKNV